MLLCLIRLQVYFRSSAFCYQLLLLFYLVILLYKIILILVIIVTGTDFTTIISVYFVIRVPHPCYQMRFTCIVVVVIVFYFIFFFSSEKCQLHDDSLDKSK